MKKDEVHINSDKNSLQDHSFVQMLNNSYIYIFQDHVATAIILTIF